MSRRESGRDGPGGPRAEVVGADVTGATGASVRRGLTGPGTSRRAVVVAPLAVVVAGAAAACTGSSDRPAPSAGASPSPTPVDPDDALRAAAAGREQWLLQAYDAVLAGLPELAPRLGPLRAHHVEHLRALQQPDASPSPSASASPAPPVAAPTTAEAALRSLVAAERTAGAQHGADCLAASRGLAGLLGALSASELTHAAALA